MPGKPAARAGDLTAHSGVIAGPGVRTVLIGGRPAAVLGDRHACPQTFHPPTALVKGSTTVLIGGRPAARVDDLVGCGASVISGAPTVLIGG